LSQLSPDFYAVHQVQLINSSNDFGQRLMSCKQAVGEYRFTREGSCAWLQYDAYDADSNAHGDYKAVEGSTTRMSVGAQKTLPSDWSYGFGLTREDTTSRGYDDRWSSRGDIYHFGLSAKRRFGPTKLSGVLSYGWSETDSNRTGELLGGFTTRVTRDVDVLSAVLRGSHDFEFESWYLRPLLDVGLTQLRARGAQEEGTGGSNLRFESYNESHTWLRPAVEIGKEFKVGAESFVRLNLSINAQKYIDGSATDVNTQLAGAPSGIAPLSVGMDLGAPLYGSKLGVEFFNTENLLFQLYYGSNNYDHSDIRSMNLRFQIPLH
jgi:hypothetical protein